MNYTTEQLKMISQALDFTTDAVGIVDTDGNLVYFNPALKKLLTDPHKFVSDYWEKLFKHDISLGKIFLNSMVKGSTWEKELDIKCPKCDEYKTFKITIDAIKSDEEKIIGFVGTLKNIDDYKKMQKELKILNKKLSKQVENKTTELYKSNKALVKKLEEIELLNEQLENMNQLLQDNSKLFVHGPVMVFKRVNDKGRPIEYVSPNIEKILGYTPEEIRQQKFYEKIVHQQDLQRLQQESENHCTDSNRETSQKVYRVLNKKGEEVRVLDYTNFVREPDGKVTHFIGYLIDLTAQEASKQTS